jgi:DNA-binding transcriptional ArsR family regulator
VRALGDPTRLTLAAALAQADELSVCDLAWIAERSQNLVSHHLRALRAAGLVESHREGKMVMYALTGVRCSTRCSRRARWLDEHRRAGADSHSARRPGAQPGVAHGRAQDASALLALACLDGRRGRDRDHRRRARRLNRPDLVRARLGDRGLRQRHRLALHRFTPVSHAAEERVQKLVAIQFFLLAPYVAFEAVHKLVTGEQPQTSWLGVALVTSSLIGMPVLGIAKRRLADTLGSVATRGEGTQNLLCAYLAAAVLVGLLATPSSDSGGSTQPQRSSSPQWRSRKPAQAGAAKDAARTARPANGDAAPDEVTPETADPAPGFDPVSTEQGRRAFRCTDRREIRLPTRDCSAKDGALMEQSGHNQ